MVLNWQTTLFSLCLISGLVISTAAWAALPWHPLVPCGLHADNCSDADQCPCCSCNLCHIFQLASNVINLLLYEIALPGAVLLFIAAGIIFITSGGNEERVQLAKKVFQNTVLGVFLCFMAWLIIDSILKTIATGQFYAAWSTFPTCSQ